jgi:hypothetical protein
VSYAADRHEMAPLRLAVDTPTLRVYELVTIRDEPVTIVFERDQPAPDDHPSPTAITVGVGRLGDPQREAAIGATLRARAAWLNRRD